MVDPHESSSLEILLGKEELRGLFSFGFQESSVNPVGYDLRLGNTVGHVTICKRDDLSQDNSTTIYPGETIIVQTEEALDLPDDVFALGSPKMSLLIKGLWAHGGKTDFGYNLCLTLGFQNVGCEPITLTKGQQIFHLTFFKVHNKSTKHYSGKGPDWPNLKRSVLDGRTTIINENELKQIKETDGVKIYEISKQIIALDKKIDLWYYIPFVTIFLFFMSQLLRDYNLIPTNISLILSGATTLIGFIAGSITIIKTVWERIKTKNR